MPLRERPVTQRCGVELRVDRLADSPPIHAEIETGEYQTIDVDVVKPEAAVGALQERVPRATRPSESRRSSDGSM